MAAENNTRNLQAFSRIFEVMSFVDRIQELSPEEIEETAHRLCQLPANPGNSMSLEEVVFWAGVSTGMDVSRSMQEDLLDGGSASKIEAVENIAAARGRSTAPSCALDGARLWQVGEMTAKPAKTIHYKRSPRQATGYVLSESANCLRGSTLTVFTRWQATQSNIYSQYQ